VANIYNLHFELLNKILPNTVNSVDLLSITIDKVGKFHAVVKEMTLYSRSNILA
jgi:hypothetical protein